MSENKEAPKTKTKAADAPDPQEAVAALILKELDRVHQRTPKF